jgi:xylulose-5-phosphate/fructose-6-phosphate phosphoketolase
LIALSEHNFDALFTKNKPIVFAFHGYSWLIHHLPQLGARSAKLKKLVQGKLVEHEKYNDKYGLDMPEIRKLKWKLTHE